MIDQKNIKKIYKKKFQKLLDLNKAYFEKDNPKISDSDFDELKKELLDLSNQYPFLKKVENLSKLIGSKPSNKFEKVKHSIPMLSLSNAFEREDMVDFNKKIKNYLNLSDEIQFSSDYHSANFVPIWSSGPGADFFDAMMDNTDIGNQLIKYVKNR